MSFAETENYLRNHAGAQFDFIQNGACRFSSLPDSPGSDDYGFVNENYAGRTQEFIRCRWAQKIFDEKIIGGGPRSFAGYEIVVPQILDGKTVEISTSDRIELMKNLKSDELTGLEIVAKLDQSSFSWVIYAIDADDEN
jgi:hypothetical protein